jgi:hypothetical protein
VPCPTRFGLLEFDAIDAIIETGYRDAQERIGELRIKEGT